ncbi:MAG: DUF4136 domain-containing protein [Vicinamibacteria bacterium]
MRTGAAFVLFAFAGLEAQAQTIRVRWDRDVDFSGYGSFAWMDGTLAEDPEAHEAIVQEIENELARNGIFPQPADPDLYVYYHASSREEFQIRGGYRSDWEDAGTLTVNSYVAGTLVVDLVDAIENRVVWRGTASATVSGNPRKNGARIRTVVQKMFAGFPQKP